MTRWSLKGTGFLLGCCLIITANQVLASEVTGKATFEQRTTVVPLSLCEGPNCPRPEPYWILVLDGKLDGKEGRYELDVMFARGSRAAPDRVTVAGVEIRAGSTVTLDGRIEKIGSDLALICDVQRVQLQTEPVQLLWRCDGVDLDQPFLRVEITSGQVSGYTMQVFALKPGFTLPVDRIENVELATSRSSMVFSGRRSFSTGKLRVDVADSDGRRAAEFHYRRDFPGPFYSVPLELVQKMECTSDVPRTN